MGRLDQQKGIDRLAAAFTELRASNVPFDARAIGVGVAAIASWRRVPMAGVVILAAVVTALVRQTAIHAPS